MEMEEYLMVHYFRNAGVSSMEKEKYGMIQRINQVLSVVMEALIQK
jgi:hypothetical protein